MDPLTFAQAMLDRGIEFTLRRTGRLYIWPPECVRHLTDAEREYIQLHKAELKALAASKVLPEATVVWQPPGTTTPAAAAAPTVVPCPYCGGPCCGESHPAFAALHHDDPAEVARRDARATVEMRITGRR